MEQKAKIHLGMNLNCFTNRYVLPDEWTRQVEVLGINEVQFNADILDPMLPWKIQKRVIEETLDLCDQKNIRIHSSFGGHNHHQNYLGHPDNEIANYYEQFYRALIRQTALLGGVGVGTCYAIMTVPDSGNPQRRQDILKRSSDSYHRLAEYAKQEGLSYLLFETTSVDRETCSTFQETDEVLQQLADAAVPFKLCLDVGHRNMRMASSGALRLEASPYEWISRYGTISPIIHIHQCNPKGSHHWPFTREYNDRGDIIPERIVSAINDSGAKGVLLAFEINHKAFYPDEELVIDDLQESVKYWKRRIYHE